MACVMSAYRPYRIGDFAQPANCQRIMRYLAEQTNHMINAFRHRLDKLSRERLFG